MLPEPYNNKKLINLDSIRDRIVGDFKNKKLHHSIMFVGEKGIGKSTLCYHIANKILDSETTLKADVCDSLFGDSIQNDELTDNNPTFSLIRNKKHPDLLVIEKEIDQKTSKMDREIKVSSARKLLDFMALSPFLSSNKVVIIDSIDEMNISAQNSILKAIEEPVNNTFIFLVCHNLNNVLDTIQSRCRKFHIANYSFNEWIEVLKYVCKEKYNSINNEQIRELYDLSNGSISSAIDIIEEDGLFLYNYIENILSQKIINMEDLHSLADRLNNDDKLFTLFSNFIILFLYRILKYITIGEGSSTFKEKNSDFILRNNEKKLLSKIKFVQELLKDIDRFNLNRKHAILVLFTKLRD